MDEEQERRIRERSYAIWEARGRPEGKELEHWLEAERELLDQSVAGEEDPLAGIDEEPPGAFRDAFSPEAAGGKPRQP